MKFSDIQNIWTVDLSSLSNADRGRVYFERAKQVVAEALADPFERKCAVRGTRFRRNYLVEKIGCQPAVTTQNPKIKDLLAETDRQLAKTSGHAYGACPLVNNRSAEISDLRATIVTLSRRIEIQAAEIIDLRSKLRAAGCIDLQKGQQEGQP